MTALLLEMWKVAYHVYTSWCLRDFPFCFLKRETRYIVAQLLISNTTQYQDDFIQTINLVLIWFNCGVSFKLYCSIYNVMTKKTNLSDAMMLDDNCNTRNSSAQHWFHGIQGCDRSLNGFPHCFFSLLPLLLVCLTFFGY